MSRLVLYILIFTSLSVKSQDYFNMYSWGSNGNGVLGDGTTNNLSTPAKIGNDYKWIKISKGWEHTVALKSDGTIWAWGRNNDGQLGDGTNTTRLEPTQIGTSNDWKDIKAGGYFTIAQKNDGTLWATGLNSNGQLGDGTGNTRSTFVQINADEDWNNYYLGTAAAIATKTDGSLWTWGRNISGELGDGTNTNSNIPIRIGSDNDWDKVFCGNSNSFAIKTDGTLWATGENAFGQLGIGTSVNTNTFTQVGSDSDWIEIRGGGSHTIGLKSNGELWGWGRNNAQQLVGLGTISSPGKFSGGSDWIAIGVGQDYTMAIKSDSSLYAWGRNHVGQLGLGFSGGNVAAITRVGTDNDWVFISSTIWNFHNGALRLAPTYSISGRVTDRGVGVEGVYITIGITSTYTNSSGYYTLSNIPEDDFTLNLSKSSFDFADDGTVLNVNQDINNLNFEATFVTNLPNNGDGNGDDIPDYSQSNVATILDAFGNSYITIESQDNFTLNDVYSSFPDDNLFNYPFGKTEFKINASLAEIKIYYHGIESLDGYIFRKIFSDNIYRQFDNAVFSTEIIGGNQVATVTLTLVDGGAGDYDGIVNGIIYDPGGPAISVGGQIPTLSEWARIFAFCIFLGVSIWWWRRI